VRDFIAEADAKRKASFESETRKDKVSPKLRLHELTQAKEREPSTPPPSNGSCKESSPDSVFFPPESPPLSSLSGEGSKTTKNRRPSSGPRKTHSYSSHTTGISLPLADPSLSRTELPFVNPSLSRESPGLTK